MKKCRLGSIMLMLILFMVAACETGCDGDRTADGDIRIEGGAGTVSSGNSSKNYTLFVVNRAGEVLEGALVTLDGIQKKTDQKGVVVFKRPVKSTVKLLVTCPNYWGVMYELYSVKKQGTDTVTLQPSDSSRHRLKKATYKNGNHTLDLLNQNKRFYSEGLDIKFDVDVEVIGESDTVSHYEFCQDIIENGQNKTKVIRSSVHGKFEDIRVSELAVGTKIYVRVWGTSGFNICTSLNMEKANKPAFAEEKEVSLFGDSFSVEIDEDVPWLGGTEIDMKSFTFPVYTKMTHDEDGNATVKVGFNIDKNTFDDDAETNQLKEILSKADAAQNVLYNRKDLYDRLSSSQERKGNLAMGGCEFLGKPEVVFTGYAEGGFDSYGELSSVSGKVAVIIKQKLLDGSWQFMVTTVPVVVQIEGKVEAKTTGGITYDFDKNEFNGNLKLSIKPQVTLKGGTGVKGASIGMYGSVQVPVELIIADSEYKTGINSIDMDAEVGVYGEILVFEAKKKLKNGFYNIWSRSEEQAKKYKKTSNNKKNDLYILKNYSPLRTSENPVIKVQNNKKSDALSNDIAILNKDASRGATPVIASNGTHALSIYSSQHSFGNAENSYAKLYYSFYKDGKWSDGVSVDNDICNEMNPQVFSCGNDYYIVYQESNFDYSKFDDYENLSDDEKTARIETFAKSVDLHIKRYNVASNSFVDYGKIKTDGEYDYGAEIILNNGIPYVYWLKNNNADVFGTKENTETNVMTAKYESGVWNKSIIKTTKNLVTALEIGKTADILTCVYTEDEDKNTDTKEDVMTYFYKNNVENSVYNGKVDSLVYSSNSCYYILSGTDVYECNSDGVVNKVAEDINCFNNSFSVIDNKLYYASVSDKYSELYVRRKNDKGIFVNPVKVTNNQKWIRDMSATMIEGKEAIIFLSEDFAQKGEEEKISSQIMVCKPHEYTDLCIIGAELTDIEQVPIVDTTEGETEEKQTENVSGTAVDAETNNKYDEYGKLSIVIKNNGTEAINSFALAVKDANNSQMEIDNTDYSKTLVSGEETTINVRVKLSDKTAYGKWKINCDVSEEGKEDVIKENNSCEIKAGTSAISVTTNLYNSGAYTYLILNVKNSGRVKDSAKLNIKNANNVSEIFASYNIDNLEPGDAHLFKVRVPDKWCDNNGKVALLITTSNSLYDGNVFDNYSYEYATLNYGKYRINYVLNGGKYNNNPATYTTTSSFRFSAPTRSGYNFAGWYGKSNLTEISKVSQITYGSAGDLTLYAKWTKSSNRKTISKKVTNSNTKRPGKVKITYRKNKKSRKVLLKWKKVSGAKGYQLQYALNKKFTKKKKSKLTKKRKYIVTKLKKKKTYYFRVRAYKLNGKKKVYGKWSKVKKVKIKK